MNNKHTITIISVNDIVIKIVFKENLSFMIVLNNLHFSFALQKNLLAKIGILSCKNNFPVKFLQKMLHQYFSRSTFKALIFIKVLEVLQ